AFRPFDRVAGAGEHAGAGLGLTLVRQIARRHGGDAVSRVRGVRGLLRRDDRRVKIAGSRAELVKLVAVGGIEPDRPQATEQETLPLPASRRIGVRRDRPKNIALNLRDYGPDCGALSPYSLLCLGFL